MRESDLSSYPVIKQIKNAMQMDLVTPIVSKANDWVRIGRIPLASASISVELLITNGYAYKSPVPLVCLLGGSPSGNALSCTRLSPTKINDTGSSARPSYKAARFVNVNGVIYFEVQIDTAEVDIHITALSANESFDVLTPTISNATQDQVIKTFDLT